MCWPYHENSVWSDCSSKCRQDPTLRASSVLLPGPSINPSFSTIRVYRKDIYNIYSTQYTSQVIHIQTALCYTIQMLTNKHREVTKWEKGGGEALGAWPHFFLGGGVFCRLFWKKIPTWPNLFLKVKVMISIFPSTFTVSFPFGYMHIPINM